MTPQRKWQLENKAKGLCAFCKEKRVNALYCEKHRLITNAYIRKYKKRLKSGEVIPLPSKRFSSLRQALKDKRISYTTLKQKGLI